MPKPLRLWPGVAAASLIVIGFILSLVPGALAMIGLLIVMVGALIVALWWLLFSRARWYERLGAVTLVALAIIGMRPLLDKSIATGGQGYLPILSVPLFATALVVWAATTKLMRDGARRLWFVGALAIVVGLCTTVRTAGVIGGGGFDFHWRWTPTPEDRLLARVNDEPAPIAPAPAPSAAPSPAVSAAAPVSTPAPGPVLVPPTPRKAADWPGFRGPDRNGVVHVSAIETDWTKAPPSELWRRPVGPGWSSFAVDGDFFFTQEQRGADEIVTCYRLSTGAPVWRHRDRIRFWESNGGAGPRGTPTLRDGRVYTMGATGVLNVLDQATGAVIWSRDAAKESNTTVPMWGISSSPLVVKDVVVVATAGTLVGFDVTTGERRWVGPKRGFSYSSPQLVTFDGVDQVVLLASPGIVSVAPDTGKLLWEYKWDGGAIVQPGLTEEGDVLINSISGMGGLGMRRLAVKRSSASWSVEDKWTSNGLKPYYSDFVVHKGHAYGFDGAILSAINLADGKRDWKGGRYGQGQLVLLPEQDLLLVVSEEGELALVSATPDQFREIARFKGIEGKTWNHPVLVHDVLLVRNGEEMAAFRLPLLK